MTMIGNVPEALGWVLRQGPRQFPVLLQILVVVRREQRRIPRDVGVLPREVQPRLDFGLAEQTVRRLMAALWRVGLLERIGGEGCRRGYRLAV